jgi:hypothetical protein
VTFALIVYFVALATVNVQLGDEVVVPRQPLAGRPVQEYEA